jgi:hypothetical protein
MTCCSAIVEKDIICKQYIIGDRVVLRGTIEDNAWAELRALIAPGGRSRAPARRV